MGALVLVEDYWSDNCRGNPFTQICGRSHLRSTSNHQSCKTSVTRGRSTIVFANFNYRSVICD
jgi:hypothetical protein